MTGILCPKDSVAPALSYWWRLYIAIHTRPLARNCTMFRFKARICLPLLLILVIGLTGCQDSLVEPATEPTDPNAPMSQAEFDKQIAENGMVVLEPKDYEAFGGPLAEAAASKASCNTQTSGDIDYKVCSNVASIVIDNVDFFRVTIDASIQDTQFECPGRQLLCSPLQFDFVSITSTTVRGGGVTLQNNEYDGNDQNAATDFVAVYPQADTFTFDHTSDFSPVNDEISVHLSP